MGLEGYKVWGSQALWWSSVLVKVVGHLLSKLSWICLGNFWIRELTNNITMQNSIASFEFDSETRWPTLNMGLGGLKFNPSSLKQFKGHYAFICVFSNTNFHLLINNIYIVVFNLMFTHWESGRLSTTYDLWLKAESWSLNFTI